MLFEVVELHFDKLAMFQRIIQGCKELRAQTLFAHLQGGLEPLSLGFENTHVRVGERNHGAKILESARQVTPLPLLFRCGTPLGLSEMNEAQILKIAVYSPVWALIYLNAN